MIKFNELAKNEDLSDLSSDDLTTALESLIERGILEKVEASDGTRYRLTKFGITVKQHMNSDPQARN